MNYTSIEQSKKLLELGLNPDTADMYWTPDADTVVPAPYITKTDNETLIPAYKGAVPCWSLSALMNLLPPSIQTGEGMHNQYEIDIRKYWGDEENLYQIAYGNDRGFSEEWHDMINTGEEENLIDAAFQMVVWLLENNYIKKEKQ